MNVNSVPLSVSITSPAIWAGTYGYVSGGTGGWSWYKDKNTKSQCMYAIPPDVLDPHKPQMNFAPHVTISVAPHETGPGNTWIGFHVSIPLPAAGVNARFNYKIVNGRAQFSNTTKQGFSSGNLAMIERIEQMAQQIDQFANAFVTAAWKK